MSPMGSYSSVYLINLIFSAGGVQAVYGFHVFVGFIGVSGNLLFLTVFLFLQQAVYDRMLVFILYSIVDGVSMLIYCSYCMNCRQYHVYLLHLQVCLKEIRKWYCDCII